MSLVIQEHSHTKGEICHRWLRTINAKLTDDKITATKIKRDKKTIQKVKGTYPQNQMDLPMTGSPVERF